MAWYDSPEVRRALAAGEEAEARAEALLTRCQAGRREWDTGPVLRQRAAAAQAQSAREAAEVSRALRLARGHDRAHTAACSGPVSNYEPDDPRRVDCLANWPPGPGECACGCGASSGVVSRQEAVWPGDDWGAHDHPYEPDEWDHDE